jgi:Zn-dependent peptidase ImmA (M78 family)
VKPRTSFLRKAAQQILKDCKISDPPVDLEKIIKKHGLEYQEVDYFEEGVDAMIVPIDGRVIAAVNQNSHIHRRRFSLAHELCHHIFHRDRAGLASLHKPVTIDSPPEFDSVEGKDPFETEADIFAGELLVPVSMLKKHYRPGHTADDVARIFHVSPAVASIAIASHFNALFKSL